ncbi:unnamed protein product [Hymenolepis diminuta]|uniref:Uncharacterized protein n=1 Tax=Hymenolepis diminuta TaxID=6216 RepID=A0A564YMR3_HYMDI|nr:unnamed protein product [Hymenolepis diminuta]
MYLDTYDHPLPWDFETLKTQCRYRPDNYSGRFRRPLKRFKVDPTPRRIEK